MVIYTSYFGNIRKLQEAGIVPIGIALWSPRFFSGINMFNLAPTKYMLSPACKNAEYEHLYKQDILGRLNPREFIQTLQRYDTGNGIALCCYEKPDDFCHRHFLAEWIIEKTGLEVKEFGYVKKQPIPVQGSLF